MPANVVACSLCLVALGLGSTGSADAGPADSRPLPYVTFAQAKRGIRETLTYLSRVDHHTAVRTLRFHRCYRYSRASVGCYLTLHLARPVRGLEGCLKVTYVLRRVGPDSLNEYSGTFTESSPPTRCAA